MHSVIVTKLSCSFFIGLTAGVDSVKKLQVYLYQLQSVHVQFGHEISPVFENYF